MDEKKHRLRITFNSPVILGFSFLCLLVLGLDMLTDGWTNAHLFSVYRSGWLDPLTYIRIWGHVLGHANWEHFIGNITLILIVGPLLEEKYGSGDLLVVMVATALVTGIVHIIFFPNTGLLGASGIVFALILLSSITSLKSGEIPITFILVALIYIGGEIYQGIFVEDNVSNLTHILGGVVGSGLGFFMTGNNKKAESTF